MKPAREDAQFSVARHAIEPKGPLELKSPKAQGENAAFGPVLEIH